MNYLGTFRMIRIGSVLSVIAAAWMGCPAIGREFSDTATPDRKVWAHIRPGLSELEVFAWLGRPWDSEVDRALWDNAADNDVRFFIYTRPFGYVVRPSDAFPYPLEYNVNFHPGGHVYENKLPWGAVENKIGARPLTPVLWTPPDGATYSHTPRYVDFRWPPSDGPYPLRYEIECGRMPSDGMMQKVYTSFVPYKAVALPTAGTWTWRLRTVNAQGASAWTAPNSFTFTR